MSLGSGLGLVVLLAKHASLVAACHGGELKVVEGTVQVQRRQPAGGHASGDLVVVDGHALEIDHFVCAPGYRQTIAHRGALREGVRVRLHVARGRVLKVEVPVE